MDINNIHYLLNTIKEMSDCLDKQVSCIITDKDNNILSMGWNQVEACDKNCHDKKNRICETVHAEVVAMGSLSQAMKKEATTAYVSLFPCKPCQQFLKDNGVTKIISFTANHKGHLKGMAIEYPKNVNDLLLKRDGVHTLNRIDYTDLDLQYIYASLGILGREITLIMENKKVDVRIYKKIMEAELQMEQLKLILWSNNPDFYNQLRRERSATREHVLRLITKRV